MIKIWFNSCVHNLKKKNMLAPVIPWHNSIHRSMILKSPETPSLIATTEPPWSSSSHDGAGPGSTDALKYLKNSLNKLIIKNKSGAKWAKKSSKKW